MRISLSVTFTFVDMYDIIDSVLITGLIPYNVQEFVASIKQLEDDTTDIQDKEGL